MNFDTFIKELKEALKTDLTGCFTSQKQCNEWNDDTNNVINFLAQKYKEENTTAWKFDCNTDLDKLKENKEGCGKEFIEGDEEYYCGDLDYSDKPVIHYCPECRSQQINAEGKPMTLPTPNTSGKVNLVTADKPQEEVLQTEKSLIVIGGSSPVDLSSLDFEKIRQTAEELENIPKIIGATGEISIAYMKEQNKREKDCKQKLKVLIEQWENERKKPVILDDNELSYSCYLTEQEELQAQQLEINNYKRLIE